MHHQPLCREKEDDVKKAGYCVAYVTNVEGNKCLRPFVGKAGVTKSRAISNWNEDVPVRPYRLYRKRKCLRLKVVPLYVDDSQ